MNDKKFSGGIQKIRNILSTLDEGSVTPKEAKRLFEQGILIIEECDLILNNYKGIREEIS